MKPEELIHEIDSKNKDGRAWEDYYQEEDWRDCGHAGLIKKSHWIALVIGLGVGALLGYSAHAEETTKPGVCEATLMELKDKCKPLDYGHSFQDCMAKQGRFNMATGASSDSRLYAIWDCGYNQGIRKHNDP